MLPRDVKLRHAAEIVAYLAWREAGEGLAGGQLSLQL